MNSILKYIFILTGTKFYMDYLLITNPVSKIILIKSFYENQKGQYTAYKYNERLRQAIILGSIHLVYMTILFIFDAKFIINLLINIYPLIIQIYIGYRCWVIKKTKLLYE